MFKKKLEMILLLKNKMITAFGEKPLKLDEVYQEEFKKFKKIKHYVKDTFEPVMQAVKQNKKIICEGAQGTFLDNDWGTYPFVTGSNMVAGNINSGAGISPVHIKKITGIVKAYTTRVGGGPFPTEQLNQFGELLQKVGAEFGATTGRARRCGWLDLELLRFAVELNGFTELVITKLDVLDDFKAIKICHGYKLNGKKVKYIDCDAHSLSKVKPVYKIMKGWNSSIKNIKKFEDLPKQAKTYLKEITDNLKIPISLISVGPERNQTIIC